ncbi:MAG: carboxymuconolactone decarboxylase family protein [Dehalococcoidia bacterium]|nr:carboxymuconolactone decarboxylase family protein [Dehalococcoidia bacterium]
MPFSKRTYRNPNDFFSDLLFSIRNGKRLKELRGTGLITPAFRERLMLAVTAVNGCSYCSYVHAKQALKSGLGQREIEQLLSGDIGSCPGEEALAVIYAQHWAETNAHPDPETVQKLRETYGSEKADAIHLVLRIIRLGNLSGNSLDYFLYLISFGRWQR